MFNSLRKFRTAKSGLAAVEFSMAMPVLLVALLGFFELNRYITMTRKLEATANSIAEMLTQSQNGVITPVDVTFAKDFHDGAVPRRALRQRAQGRSLGQ